MARQLLWVGLGGFTTFSAFGHEVFLLLQGGRAVLASAYLGAQLVLGVAAVWLGDGLARWP